MNYIQNLELKLYK